jgi:hypothetical protein
MMRKIFWGAIFLVPSLLLPLVPALAQLDPTNGPNLSGPIAPDKPTCFNKLERDPRTDPNPRNGSDKDQTVMAQVRLCSWLLTYDPDQDGNISRDYGAAWVQTSIDARNGYCVRNANTKIRLPLDEGTAGGRTPHRSVTIASPRRKNVSLKVAPANATGRDATIAQHFRLYPKSLEVAYKVVENGRLYLNNWKGHATDEQTLSFATGVKMSWLTSNGSPEFLPRFKYHFIVPDDDTPRVCG